MVDLEAPMKFALGIMPTPSRRQSLQQQTYNINRQVRQMVGRAMEAQSGEKTSVAIYRACQS